MKLEEILLRANEAEMKQNLNYVGRCEVFLGDGFEGIGGNDGTGIRDFIPIASVGMVYLPTFKVDFNGKCRQLYHAWMLGECLGFRSQHINWSQDLVQQDHAHRIQKKHGMYIQTSGATANV